MNNSVIFSNRVINTLNSLPIDDRSAIARALMGEFVLGTDALPELTAIQRMVYAIVRNYVKQDMRRIASVHPIIEMRDLAI